MAGPPYTPPAREDLLRDLNPAQRRAVVHAGGALLVVAGAGTGKTRVLTRRVAWLVLGGLPARSVLAITFTNKAAQVLKERLAELPRGEEVWAGTFHAFCAWLLRVDGDRIGIDPSYTVLDREDQHRLLRDILKDLGAPASLLRPHEAAAAISYRKNGGSGRVPVDLSLPERAALLDEVVDRYDERRRRGALLDFDDLLLEACRLLETHEETADRMRRRFAHLLVDEYQDTNHVQARLLKALVRPSGNITVVGDPDQSIYRWRGAAVENILGFEKEFSGATRILLEQNYRSTARILAAAEHVIARNVHRHEKRLFTEAPEGARLREIGCRDAQDEAQAVAGVIQRWRAEGRPPEAIAVFYRVNALSRSLELGLRAAGIPYVIVAGVEFFQRKEVKDLLAYARLVENPRDEAAFLRIVNVPRRGVGASSLRALRAEAVRRGVPTSEAARRPGDGISGRARKGLAELVGLLDRARELPRAPVGLLLKELAELSGYRAHLEAQEDELGRARVENLDELVGYARELDKREPEGDLRSFLERAALVSDQDAYEGETGRVSLMSVHAAKGLEFPCVVIAGAEMDWFPHALSAGEEDGEEERRLFYVAMTRAKEQLVMTHAASRFTYRGEERRTRSPFLADVPAEVLETESRHATPHDVRPSEPYDVWDGGDEDVLREVGGSFGVGDRVRHPYFGEGLLCDRQGQGAHTRVTIDFAAFGRKQLLLSHARLERVP